MGRVLQRLGDIARRLRRGPAMLPEPDLEDWHPGDIAECVFAGPWQTCLGLRGPGPQKGERLRVVAVEALGCHCGSCGRATYLRFPTFAPIGFHAGNFRKVVPEADALVAADPAFLDRWISQPEQAERLRRWQLKAEMAIVTAAAVLVGAPALAAVLTRGPA